MRKKKILFLFAVLVIGSVLILKSGNIGTTILWNLSNEGKWFLPLVIAAALIDSVNPCAFGILLLTIAFLLSLQKTRIGIIKIGGFYILGLLATYILIGLGILKALHLFNTPHFMAKIGATLLIIWGVINLVNKFVPSFPINLGIPKWTHNKMATLISKVSLPTAFLLGMLVGLCEFPCTGGPYLMVIGLLHDKETYLSGISYLLLYNLIFILPLIIILIGASDATVIDKIQSWKKTQTSRIKLWSGVVMIILGFLTLLFLA